MSVNDQFCMSPETFLRKNIVIQRVPGEPDVGDYTDAAKKLLKVVVVDTGKRVSNNRQGKVCYMRLAHPGELPSLLVYWCPYVQDDLRGAALANDALFMFTPTMNGCSLGVGSYAGNGVRLVTHVNMANSGAAVPNYRPVSAARAQQRKLQRNILISEHGPTVDIISPEQYMTDNKGEETMESTTFGIHGIGQDWQFFTLSYKKLGPQTYSHGGVKQRI